MSSYKMYLNPRVIFAHFNGDIYTWIVEPLVFLGNRLLLLLDLKLRSCLSFNSNFSWNIITILNCDLKGSTANDLWTGREMLDELTQQVRNIFISNHCSLSTACMNNSRKAGDSAAVHLQFQSGQAVLLQRHWVCSFPPFWSVRMLLNSRKFK